MKVNAFVAAGVGSLILASAASADFTNITAEFTGTASAPGDTGFWAVRIYANFTSADDRLLSVIGADYSNLGDQSLYQNAFGSGVEPSAALIPVFPDLEWTSFVTIGHTQTVVGESTTSLDPDGEWLASGFTGGYFIPGDAPQGLAGSGLKVLIAQLTIENPNASAGVGGTATVAWEGGGIAGGGTQFSEIDFEYFIPAPGALALLGLAGLAGRRRRR